MALGNQFDVTIIKIAYKTGYLQSFGEAADGIAESDSLNPS